MKLWFKPDFLAILFICFVSLYALKDLTIPSLYTSHDGETHTARIAQYYQAILDGQIPPRFAGSFYNGFGSPIFVYIYPLPYILGSIFHTMGFTFVNSFKVIMALGFIFSGIFSYLWLKELFLNKQASFLGALFYMYSPYRLQLIYVRGSISEHLAYVFLPLVLYSITRMTRNNSSKLFALSTLGFTGIFLSQNLVALLTLPIIALYSIYLAYSVKSKTFVVKTSMSFLWALAISSFTYIPAIFERQYTRFDEIFSLVYDSHFVTLKQLIRSPWGYGFDLAGTLNDQMSFQIGLAHILMLIIGTFLFLAILFNNLITKKNMPQFKSNHAVLFIAAYFSIMLCVFLILETTTTRFVWDNFKLLHFIDIPWRILGLVPLFVALITAFIASRLNAGLIFLALSLAVLIANRNHIHINKALEYSDEFFLNYRGSATQLSEFTPITRNNTSAPEFNTANQPISLVNGWGEFSNISANSKNIKFSTSIISEQAQVRINKFYFPGVNVKIYDNGSSAINYMTSSKGNVRLNRKEDTRGLIFIPLQKGSYDVLISFRETALRNVANLISVISILLLLLFLNRPKRIFTKVSKFSKLK